MAERWRGGGGFPLAMCEINSPLRFHMGAADSATEKRRMTRVRE